MKTPATPANENERLEALNEYEILDSLPERAYDDITKIASQICNTPVSLISLIDTDRQWFKSNIGIPAPETPRDIAYCAHAINTPEQILEIKDAFEDERFHDNPLATGDPSVRFYAGAPLTDSNGMTLGTLCVIDHVPNELTEGQKESLWALSRQVVTLLEFRKENLRRKKTEDDFKGLMENLGDGIFELDGQGNCTYVNAKMLSMLKMTRTEMLNTATWDLIYSEDVVGMQDFYVEQFKEESPKCIYKYRLNPKEGEPIWVVQNTTMQYRNGRMIKLRSISRDISDTLKLEEELKEKESLYKLVSENSSDLIALHEPDGTYKYLSPSLRDLLGYESKKLVGQDPYDFIHPDDHERIRSQSHEKILEGESAKVIEVRLRAIDGSYTWFESFTTPILNDSGEVISLQSASRNITERKREKLRIERHIEGLRLLNELAGGHSGEDIVLDLVLEKVAKYLGLKIGMLSQIEHGFCAVRAIYNPEFVEIGRFAESSISNTCCQEVYDKSQSLLINEAPDAHTIKEHPLLPNLNLNTYAGTLILKNGVKFGVLEFMSNEILEIEFNSYDREFLQLLSNWIGSILEAQEERELLESARANAEAAAEAKASFLSMMSHEIRTPLNGIIGTTHLLMNKSAKMDEEMLFKILSQSNDNLLAIVNDILDFNKIEQGKVYLENRVFDLKDLLGNIYDNYKVQGEDKGLSVQLNLDEKLADFYYSDSVRISQVLHNLLSNAVKFTKKGVVSLDVSVVKGTDNIDLLTFAVGDSGVGIPEEKQSEVFEVFIQADKSTTREFGGSGLGLAITRKLINLMGSEIHLTSVAGEGTKFSFSLSLMQAQSDSSNYAAEANVDFENLNVKILLVEDNEHNRLISKEFLESWGCTVIEAGDGEEAMSMLEVNNPDIVLLDLQMPVMDGYETIHAIRKSGVPRVSSLKVIALTAAAMGDVEAKVYESGMDAYISKPFHPKEFYKVIAENLKK